MPSPRPVVLDKQECPDCGCMTWECPSCGVPVCNCEGRKVNDIPKSQDDRRPLFWRKHWYAEAVS